MVRSHVRERVTRHRADRRAVDEDVGVASGPVFAGEMGVHLGRREFNLVGDPVNVASRLEGRTKFYGVGILVGEDTLAKVKDVIFKEIDRIKAQENAE